MKSFLNKKLISYFIKIIIGLGLYLYLFLQNKINFDFFQYKNSFLLIQLFALQVFMLAIGTLRWHRIGVYAFGMKISLLTTAYISWIGQFFSTFLPSTVGADLSRIYYVSKKINMPKKKLLKITIMDRLTALLTVITWSALGLVFYFKGFNLFMSVSSILTVLALLRLLPKRKLKQILFKKDIKLPPFSVVILSLFIFLLKALSLFLIIYLVRDKGGINDYYLCLGSQFIEGLRILPANIGMGHILFDKALGLIENINGAQIYNIYFTVKILFKVTGLVGWLFIRTN
ncbi:lysylphosphatidylglycerol synthase domain-containing protein [Candidatus Omnitrophota bacterium]